MQEKEEYKVITTKKAQITEAFSAVNRAPGIFHNGDVIITTNYKVQQVGKDLSKEKVQHLYANSEIKGFLPADAYIDLEFKY